MSANRISTTGQLVLKSVVVENNKASGNGTTYVWTGSETNIRSQRMVELGRGASVVKMESTQDGNYQLTSQYAYDVGGGGQSALPVNAHELENNMENVDVYNSDALRGKLYASFGSWAGVNGAITFIKGHVEQYESSVSQPDADTNEIGSKIEALFNIYTGAQKTLMLNLFRGIALHRIKQCPQFNSVYRRRITAANPNQVKASFTGVGKIWTTAEIAAFEGVPSLWWFNLPADKQWLKVKPAVNTVAGQKTEIIYSYIAASYWWDGIHEAYGTATLISF